MKKIKNIIFDFNGTLIDDSDVCISIYEEMREKYHMRKYTRREYRDSVYFPMNQFYYDSGCSVENYPIAASEFSDKYIERYPKESKLCPGVKTTLNKLKKLGYKIYCLSASKQKTLEYQLNFYGILRYFDGIIGSQDKLATGKIEYGKQFLKDHNVNLEETVLIGDTCHDYECAEAFNVRCMLYTGGHNSRKALKKSKAILVDSYKELFELITKK